MTNEPLAADAVFDAIADELTARLAPSGWMRRRRGLFYLRTWTRPAGTGVIATVDIRRRRAGPGDHWPMSVMVRVGVGIEPVLGLLPLVTLPPVATLYTDRPESPLIVTIENAGVIDSVVDEIVPYVETNAAIIVARFTPELVVDALARDAEREGPWSQRRREVHLVALASASIKGDAALALIPTYLQQFAHGPLRWTSRRFARQLTRYIESGPNSIPTAERTVAALRYLSYPPDPPAAAEVKRRKDAELQAYVDVNRRADRDTTARDLRRRLGEAYARRGVYMSPTAAALAADGIATSKRPFGTVFNVAVMIRNHAIAMSRRLRRRITGVAPLPDWSRPPPTATYWVPVPMRRTAARRAAEVLIDDRVHDWLTHVWSTTRAGHSIALLAVWLTRTPQDAEDGTITVHVGQESIGTISPDDAAHFAEFVRAANIFDELLVLPASIFHASDGVNIAEIPLPDRTEIPDDEAAFHLHWPPPK
jgi:hypothetical protein